MRATITLQFNSLPLALLFAAAAAQCLAEAPRLAAHDYATPARTLLRHAPNALALTAAGRGRQGTTCAESPVQIFCQLQCSLVHLAVSHGPVAATRLNSLLLDLLSPSPSPTLNTSQGLASLCVQAQVLLLHQLPAALAALAPSRAAVALPAVANHVAALHASTPHAPTPPNDAQLEVTVAAAAWQGVGGVLACSSSQPITSVTPTASMLSHASVQSAAHEAVHMLWSLLPPLPPLLSGEVAMLRAAIVQQGGKLDPSPSHDSTTPTQEGSAADGVPGQATVGMQGQQGEGGQGVTELIPSMGLAAGPYAEVLAVWAAAVHALLQCEAPTALPTGLTDDAQLTYPTSETGGRESVGGSAVAAAMRCLLVLCGGGRGGWALGHLAAVRGWCAAPVSRTLTVQGDAPLRGVQGVLAAALAAVAPTAMQVQIVTEGLGGSGGRIAAPPHASCLAVLLAAELGCQADRSHAGRVGGGAVVEAAVEAGLVGLRAVGGQLGPQVGAEPLLDLSRYVGGSDGHLLRTHQLGRPHPAAVGALRQN